MCAIHTLNTRDPGYQPLDKLRIHALMHEDPEAYRGLVSAPAYTGLVVAHARSLRQQRLSCTEPEAADVHKSCLHEGCHGAASGSRRA